MEEERHGRQQRFFRKEREKVHCGTTAISAHLQTQRRAAHGEMGGGGRGRGRERMKEMGEGEGRVGGEGEKGKRNGRGRRCWRVVFVCFCAFL